MSAIFCQRSECLYLWRKKEEKIADILSSVHFLVANVTISYSVHEIETNKNNGENKIFSDGNKFLITS